MIFIYRLIAKIKYLIVIEVIGQNKEIFLLIIHKIHQKQC